MPAAVRQQDAFRGRNDDGTEATATWIALINTNWSQAVDVNFRVRFNIHQSSGGGGPLVCQLQYNLASAGWVAVNAYRYLAFFLLRGVYKYFILVCHIS